MEASTSFYRLRDSTAELVAASERRDLLRPQLILVRDENLHPRLVRRISEPRRQIPRELVVVEPQLLQVVEGGQTSRDRSREHILVQPKDPQPHEARQGGGNRP